MLCNIKALVTTWVRLVMLMNASYFMMFNYHLGLDMWGLFKLIQYVLFDDSRRELIIAHRETISIIHRRFGWS